MTKVVTGQCYCGAIQFQLALPPKFIAHCYCSQCRRIHGAPVVTWVGVLEENQFEIKCGSEFLSTFQSSKEAQRQFCKICGNHLFFRSSRYPGEVHLTRANLIQDDGLEPQGNAFLEDKAKWFHLLDGKIP